MCTSCQTCWPKSFIKKFDLRMSRERSRSPVQPSLGSGSSNDDEYQMKRQLLVLTLMTVVRAGIEVVEKTLEARGRSVQNSPNCSIPTQAYETQDCLNNDASSSVIDAAESPERVKEWHSPAYADSPVNKNDGSTDISLVPLVEDEKEAAKLAYYGYHFHDGDDAGASPTYHKEKDMWERKFKELGLFQDGAPSPLDKKTVG